MSQSNPHNQPLPKKEDALFKQVVKFYEEKHYKKAIKTADQILKKFPDHGETLSMKGLTLSNMGPEKKEEAYELVRRGLKADLKSHVCWHVYGLLYRADRDYKEAIKCYLNALRLDKDNAQILRDLAGLQIQMRDLQGYTETRQRLLVLKPSNRINWISFALAHHANKQYDVAVTVLDAYEGTLNEIPAGEEYEHSELILYKALVLDEGGKLEEALTLLDKEQDDVKDKLGRLEHRASLLQRLGRAAEAEEQYRDLLAMNPDHYRWHEALQSCMGLRASSSGQSITEEQREGLKSLYKELADLYPHSSACKRIPLDFLQGAEFEAAADAFVRRYLTKGIPSLFMALRPLYSDSDKVASLQKLFEGYAATLAETGNLPPSLSGSGGSASANGHPEAKQESPMTRVWVLYYLAQHYDYLRDHTKALQLLSEAQQHTPTLIELYTTKSKLLRHAGDLEGAADAAETARRFDLSDRYLNSQAVKALLRANKNEAADMTATLFVKEGDLQQGVSVLQDSQHMWYECAAGDAYLRRKEYGKALKKYTTVIKHFEDIEEDQFDFHGYCARKTTLRAYVSMLRWEDTLYSSPFYIQAASGAIRTYLALADQPSAAQQVADEEAMLAAMTPEDRKKYKLKKKKEEKKAAAAKQPSLEASKPAAATAESSKDGKKKSQAAASERPKDCDPDGAKLAACEDPLAEATKLVVSLKQHASSALETHLLAAEVYCRRRKLLLALAAVQNAVRIDTASNPSVHKALVRLCQTVAAPKQPDQPASHPTVEKLISEGVFGLLSGSGSISQYHNSWVQAHGTTSLPHRIAAAECTMLLGGQDAKKQATDLLLQSITSGQASGTHKECVAVATLLSSPAIGNTEAVDAWRTACASAFPYSRYFGGSQCIPLTPDYNFETMTEAFGRLAF